MIKVMAFKVLVVFFCSLFCRINSMNCFKHHFFVDFFLYLNNNAESGGIYDLNYLHVHHTYNELKFG